jgi:1-acyl-sn-glycerol-3-phosphate acyltransferase
LSDVAISDDILPADLGSVIQTQKRARAGDQLPARQPGWSQGPVGRLLRSVFQPLVIGSWSTLYTRPVVTWPENGARVSDPFIVAAAPHRHWLDTFIIYSALPRHLRRRLMIVTNRDFREYFAPSPDTALSTRLSIGIAYYALVPLIFSFAILPSFGTTRAGLYETGRLLENGYSPITFPKGFYFSEQDAQRHDLGVALLAIQTQSPILPAWLSGNDDLDLCPGRRRQVTVHFGEPVLTKSDTTIDQVVEEVERAFASLASRSM